MKHALVFGGTRFFGEKAVGELIDKGVQVTIATRGKSEHPFGDKVQQIIVDRSDADHSGWEEITSRNWDAVFDNICFTKEDAQLAIDKLSGKTDYYLLTSTLAVYEGDKDGYAESDFNPANYVIDEAVEVTYGEGKRQAEAVLMQKSSFNLGILRIPIVLDDDDYTERLHYYIKKGQQHEEIVLNNPEPKISFIKGTDAARVIIWMIEQQKKGAYNASSTDAVPLDELMKWIEEGVEEDLVISYRPEAAQTSPFSLNHNKYLLTDKITSEGFSLPDLASWLKPLIGRLNEELKKKG